MDIYKQERKFIDAAQPLFRAKYELYSLLVPTLVIYPDETVVSKIDFSPEVQKSIYQIDEILAALALSINATQRRRDCLRAYFQC